MCKSLEADGYTEIDLVTVPSGTKTSVTILKAPITSVTASVTAPAAGAALDTTVDIGAATGYTGAVEWYEGDSVTTGSAAHGNAKPNQVYTAKVTLTVDSGESFADSVTIPAGYTKDSSSTSSKLVLTKTFPKTDSLPAASVTAPPAAMTGLKYDGTEQALLGFVGTANGGTMQYSLDNATWSTAIPMGKNAGEYTVYYKAKGNSGHSDSAVANISVTIAQKDISSVTIGSIADHPYTDSAITPDPVVTDSTTPLAKDTDYTVSCTNNKYVGTNTAKLTITGKGNYTGTKDAYFTITAVDQNPTFTTPKDLAKSGAMLDLTTLVSGAKGDVMTFTIPPATPSATLSGNMLTSTGITGEVKVSVSITEKDVDGDGTPEYNAYTGTNAITVNVVDKTAASLTVTQADTTYGTELAAPDYDTTGMIASSLRVTYKGRGTTSYPEKIARPTDAGTYTVKVTYETATKILSGSADFTIEQKSISGATVTLDKTSLEYNGGAQTVAVTGVTGLSSGDYTVTSGTSGTDVGSYTVTVTGQGNYKDIATATWEITPATLTVTPDANQSKKFKEADPAALTYTFSGNFSSQTPAFNGKLDREAGQNAGMYAIRLGDLALKDDGAFKASNYTLQLSSTPVKFEIKKADAPTLPDITVSQNYTVTTGEKAIGAVMPADAGTLTYAPGTASKTGSVTVTSWAVDTTGKVTYTLSSGAAGNTVTLPVTIESTNYADSIVNVKIILTNPSYFGGGGGGSSTPSYTVSVDKTENGTITVSPKSASKGDTVTITVKPDKGYELEMLKALDKDGDALKLTEKNGKYTFKMPSGKVTVKGSFVEEAPVQIFKDVPTDAYYYEAVKWAAEKGITGGVGNGLFAPNQPCTRAQIVTFLWRAAGSPAPKNMSSFTDVPADAFYAKAVAWAVENGITGGTGDGKFSPDATCTRAQSVTFLYRAAGSPKVSGSAEFGDVATNAYYADAVAWAAKNGITGGIGGGLFGSGNDCTRAQIVTFLYRSVK